MTDKDTIKNAEGCCSKAFDQGFKYGELTAAASWVRIFKKLQTFNFVYDARYKEEVKKLLSEINDEITEYENYGRANR